MPLFSHRKGIRPVQKAIQREVVDDELRNRLWSALKVTVWDNFNPRGFEIGFAPSRQVWGLCQLVWHNYFKKPLDTLPRFDPTVSGSSYQLFRDHFFEGEWWQVYDFLEFVLKNCQKDWAESLRTMANDVLESENAGVSNRAQRGV